MLTPGNSKIPQAKPYLAATALFRAGDDTPRAFLERCLEALAAWEPVIGAFVCTNVDGARTAADASSARWRAGKPLSAIDGMPVGVKDIIETADMPTQMGSPLFDGWQSGRDAASVAALREAGAVVLGKTVTTEFAATEPRGTRNPHDPARTPGGSSSGSAAAVAAGQVSAALGTQVVGSIIRPASYCGCVGFKPSVGAINRGGSHDWLSQSCTGVLGATLADAWQVASEIAARVGGDPGYPGLAGPLAPPPAARPVRLAVLETVGWPIASADAKTALADAVDRLAGQGVTILRRSAHPRLAAVEEGLVAAEPLSRDINAFESLWPLKSYRDRDAQKLSRALLARIPQADALGAEGYRRALAERARIRALFAALAGDCDACVTLSAPSAAPLGLQSTGNPVFTAITSLLGVPAVSLPLLVDQGLPLGLQVIGFAGGDAAAVAVAAWIMDALGDADA